MADLFQIPYVETSALTGFNVELLFRKIAKEMYVEDLNRRRHRRNVDSDPDVVTVEEREHRKIIKLQNHDTKEQKTAIPKKRHKCKCS